MTPRRREEGLVRPYVVTGGRAYPTRGTLDMVTLIVAAQASVPPELSPEKRRILTLCRRALSVAEVSGRLALPASVTKVLIGDLVDQGHLAVRRPARPAQQHDIKLLEDILNGLRALS